MILKEKTSVDNVLFVDGLKCNLLSFIQMCDQVHEVVFSSKNFLVKKLRIGNIIINETRTPKNLYILEGRNEQLF